MIDSLGAGYQFVDIATPTTNPGTPDQNVFYIAATAGTYSNFGSIVLAENEVAILAYNGTWTKKTTGAASASQVNQLAKKVGGYYETTEQETAIALNANHYYNTGFDPMSSSYGNYNGTYCARIAVTPGDKFRIQGTGNAGNIKLYAITDSSRNVVRSASGAMDTRSNPLEITIESGEAWLYVNLLNYDSSTDKLIKIEQVSEYFPGITGIIEGTGENAEITETQTVSSGARMDKTIDLSAYVGQPITFKVTRTGGTSTEYLVYNGAYSVGSLYEYGKEYSYLLNSNMSSLRFLSGAAEGDGANVTITITATPLYGLGDSIKKMFISKVVDYTGQLITGKYYNTANATLPTNPNNLADCACISGPIKEGDILKIKGKGTSKVVGFYAFYDAGKNIIMSSASASTNGQNALEIFAPVGSAYFAYNSYTYDPLDDSVAVEEVFIIEDRIEKLQTQSDNNATSIHSLEQLTWKNKTVVCFGDSITEFADSHLKSYPDYLAEVTGANVINVGVGGTRLACRTTPVVNPDTTAKGYAALDCANLIDAVASQDFSIVDAGTLYVKDNEGDDNTAIIARLKAIDWSAVDAVTFFIGTNDWGGSQNIGTSGESSKTTTLGAVNYIIDTLLTAYPHLKIYWFTPIVRWLSPRTDENWGGVVEHGGRTLEQFCDLVANEVKLNCIPVCDMYHTLGWTKANFSQYFYDTDGTHPYNGFPEIGRKFAAFINANKTF